METTAESTTTQPAGLAATGQAPAPTEAPVLVTEQQVLLSTAAAVRRPTASRRLADAFRGVAAAVHSVFSMPNPRSHAPVVPPRSRSYYESSLVLRERMRL